MAFDPQRFLILAGQLGNSTDEASLRAAVSRAYYAIFLIARDKLRVGGNSHGAVIQATQTAHKATGDQLSSLFALRVLADYDLDPQDPGRRNWTANWQRAHHIAVRLVGAVRSLAPPPSRP